MNKKQQTYVLLVIVAAIWGFIFYKFFSDVNGSSEVNYVMRPSVSLPVAADITDEKFILLADYRDPFLGTLYRPQVVSASSNKKKSKQQEVKFPLLKYMGLISNKESKRKVGMLSIDGSDHMVQVKEKVGQLNIISLSRDSIVVSIGKVKKGIRK